MSTGLTALCTGLLKTPLLIICVRQGRRTDSLLKYASCMTDITVYKYYETVGYLHQVSYVNQQPERTTSWDIIVPHAIPENLQSTDVFVDEKNGKDTTTVRVRLHAKDEIRPWTRRVVVKSGETGNPAVKLRQSNCYV